MNSVHDMGGMDGMGPIVHEQNEPVFHEEWEGRAWGLQRAVGPWGRGRWGSTRYELERIPAADYLRMSYYERWFTVPGRRPANDRALAFGLQPRPVALGPRNLTPEAFEASFNRDRVP